MRKTDAISIQRAEPTHACAVGGAIRAGAMCGSVIVGGKLCGFAGKCEHQRPRANDQPSMSATPTALKSVVSDLILDVRLVGKDGGGYCVRCPHCQDVVGIDGDDLSEIRGEQFQHQVRTAHGRRAVGCGGWMEVTDDARLVRELPPAPRKRARKTEQAL